MIPYGHQEIDEKDILAVIEVLRSDWLTTGPKVEQFEKYFAGVVGAAEAVAVSNGTAALHTAMDAVGIEPGDEVILPPITFVATANCIRYCGGTPVFADVEPDTLLIDPEQVKKKITDKTVAIICVDYAGQPCDYEALRGIALENDLVLVADSCHALGARYKGLPVGSLADIHVFSFHPVKHITTGEGGMVTTELRSEATSMRRFRNHGIDKDHSQRTSWRYTMRLLGYNYRLTDFQCALGISQLTKLQGWLARRKQIAERYDEMFSDMPGIEPLTTRPDVSHAYHLYVVRVKNRDELYDTLRDNGIGVNVHYIPVHTQPYYASKFPSSCPVAEAAYEEILTLPLYPALTDREVEEVIREVMYGLDV